MYQVEGWVVPAGALNREAALRFLQFALGPERQADFATRLAYGPVNRQAIPLIPDSRARQLSTFPENLERMLAVDARWVADHVDEMTDRWTAWKVA
jgi:putative spermidine/putrescine transport system substrate-binding protein